MKEEEKGNPADYIKGLVLEPEPPRDKIILLFLQYLIKLLRLRRKQIEPGVGAGADQKGYGSAALF